MIELEQQDQLFTLTMNAGENRWNTAFVRAVNDALDQVEASDGPAALITRSADEKFFSNGLDLAWVSEPEKHPEGGDRDVFGAEFMALMGRIITFPIPTIAAVNGHAFGAGCMSALCHDVRIVRADRGFICANEMQLGMKIPTPELALFRHKLPANTFFETVQLAKRWSGEAAVNAGVAQYACSLEELPSLAQQVGEQLAPLANNRALYAEQKERLFGESAVLDGPHGAAHMLKHMADFH